MRWAGRVRAPDLPGSRVSPRKPTTWDWLRFPGSQDTTVYEYRLCFEKATSVFSSPAAQSPAPPPRAYWAGPICGQAHGAVTGWFAAFLLVDQLKVARISWG